MLTQASDELRILSTVGAVEADTYNAVYSQTAVSKLSVLN